MKQQQQRRFDSLLRVQEFLDTNAGAVGATATSAGRKELDAAIAALTDCTNVQASTDLRLTGKVNNERALETSVRNEHMKPVATFARARLRGSPEIATLIRPLQNLHGARLVRAARAMATAAASYSDAFTAAGVPADTVEQLASAADVLQAAVTDRANAKVNRIRATKAIEEQLRAGGEAVRILHAIVSKQFASDPTFLAGWDAARRVTRKPGAVRDSGAVASITPIASAA